MSMEETFQITKQKKKRKKARSYFFSINLKKKNNTDKKDLEECLLERYKR